MATTTQSQASGSNLRFPSTLDLKDLITIISVAVSLTIAWGMFSTRLALAENEILILKQSNQQQEAEMDKLQLRLRRLENHQHDDENIFDQVFLILKKPAPIRRSE